MLISIKNPIFWHVFVGILIAIFSFILYREFVANAIPTKIQESVIQDVRLGIDKDSQHALNQTQKLVDSGILTPHIALGLPGEIRELLKEQLPVYDLTALVAVDKNGMVLARTSSANRYGDFVAQTQPWGRAAFRGESTVSFGIARGLPFVLTAAVPILSTNSPAQVQGAIFGGFAINDAYARRFTDMYLASQSQVAFYSKEKGVVASSFDELRVSALLSTYFNAGSDFVQHGEQQSEVIFNIEGKLYVISNISLQGLENTTQGGMLIFTPYPQLLFISLFLVTILLIAFMCWILFKHLKNHYPRVPWSILPLVIILVVGIVFYCYMLWSKRVIQLSHIPFTIYNSTMALAPEADVVSLASSQPITITLDSGGEPINAVGVVLLYDPKKVRVDEISTDNTLCDPNMFLERSIDNLLGKVSITCIIPSPGFTKPGGIVAQLAVQPLASGAFTLSFSDETQVLANDGLGTSVLRQVTNGSYEVLSQVPSSNALSLFSPTHPNNTRWYNGNTVRITWPAFEGSVVYGIDQSSDGTILDHAASSDDSLEFSVPSDGIYYLHMASVSGLQRGPLSTIRFNVDTTPPLAPEIKLSQTQIESGDVVRVQIVGGGDATSGLQKNYYIKFNDGILLPTGLNLSIPFQESGTHTFTVRVFDNAGNFTDVNKTVDVE